MESRELWKRWIATGLMLGLVLAHPLLAKAAAPSAPGRPTPPTPHATVVTGSVNGARGGRVTNGIWTVNIPSGAFSGTADISVSVPDLNPYTCDLQITGAPNSFRIPVRLVANTAGRPEDPSTLTIFWYNPQTFAWIDQGAAGDPATRTVAASLSHFSTYKLAQKAGW